MKVVGVLTVPEHSHHLITGRNLSVQLPVYNAKLAFARGFLGLHSSSQTDGSDGCIFVTVKKYYRGIRLQDWGQGCNLSEQKMWQIKKG